MYGPFKSITTLLIANRSEVAARIQATAQRLGIKTVCIYAADDTAQAHLALADQVYQLSGTGGSAYLNQEEIISIAKQAGANAIHPGYGFLSEVPAFCARVTAAGLQFIGPSSDTITLLGDKGQARALAQRCGIPVVPGATFTHTQNDHAQYYAEQIGYPVLLKATGGGGGRGMARINNSEEFCVVWQRIGQEGLRSFASTDIVVEKFVVNPRHIEVQVAGDGKNSIHLFERDCSTQRRRQKIIEEAPAINLTPKLRAQLHQAATTLTASVGYTGIGTVEFIVTADHQFYFLEVNTRLQVEHGVTELITGIDLVALQLHVAEHKKLPFQQHQILSRGHAIQCRVYAEDPSADFTPSTGTIFAHHATTPPFSRVEHSIELPHRVSGLYDPMLSKLLTHGITRSDAVATMQLLLRHYRLAGIITNIALLAHICAHPLFIAGNVHTQSMPQLLKKLNATSLENLAITAAQLSSVLRHEQTPLTTMPRHSNWKESQWK